RSREVVCLWVGLSPQGRAPAREGTALLDADSNRIGEITSGGFAPSLGHPISMGYVAVAHAAVGTEVQALVRNRPLPATVAKLPFVANNFYR
ncbi:MAG: glycine cleavage T C-terminal barrel domain-containing protein, partial [bacterium]